MARVCVTQDAAGSPGTEDLSLSSVSWGRAMVTVLRELQSESAGPPAREDSRADDSGFNAMIRSK